MAKFIALALAGCTALTAPADAALYLFNLTGPVTATFTLNSSPTPTNVSPKGFFSIEPVAGIYNGVATTATVYFFSLDAVENAGGMEIDVPIGETAIFARGGPLLFTGTLEAPTFKLGEFTLSAGPNAKNQILTISEVAPVPEAATWAMMVMGFGMIGGAVRMRARRTSVSFA